jgi:hypothetical protein
VISGFTRSSRSATRSPLPGQNSSVPMPPPILFARHQAHGCGSTRTANANRTHPHQSRRVRFSTWRSAHAGERRLGCLPLGVDQDLDVGPLVGAVGADDGHGKTVAGTSDAQMLPPPTGTASASEALGGLPDAGVAPDRLPGGEAVGRFEPRGCSMSLLSLYRH